MSSENSTQDTAGDQDTAAKQAPQNGTQGTAKGKGKRLTNVEMSVIVNKITELKDNIAKSQLSGPALTAELVRETGINVSESTVRNVCDELGIKLGVPRSQVGGTAQAAVIDGLLQKIDTVAASIGKLADKVMDGREECQRALLLIGNAVTELRAEAGLVKAKVEYASEQVAQVFSGHNAIMAELAAIKAQSRKPAAK